MEHYLFILFCVHTLPIWQILTVAATSPMPALNTSDGVANSTSWQIGLKSTPTNADERSQIWPAGYDGLGIDETHNPGIPNPSGFDSDFFEATEANVEAAKAGEEYGRWIILVEKNDNDWDDRTGEIQFFLHRTIGWTGEVKCGLELKGCEGVPTPIEVNNVIWNKEHARQIIYIVYQAINMNLMAGVASDLALRAEVVLGEKVAFMARELFWQFDQSIEDKCKQEAAMIQAVITAVEMAAIAAAPMLAPELAAGTIAAKAGSGAMGRMGKKVNPAKKAPWGTRARKRVRNANKGKTNVMITVLRGVPGLLSGPALEKAICDRYPNPEKGIENTYEMALSHWISKTSLAYQVFIDTEMAVINKGTGSGENGSFIDSGMTVFAFAIQDDQHVVLSDWELEHYLDSPHLLENIEIQYFTNGAISMASKYSMCYLHCAEGTLDTELANPTRRFAPEPGIVCQAQCLQDWPKLKQIAWFGTEALDKEGKEYGINPEDYWKFSYEAWKQTRYSTDADLAMPSISELWSDDTTALNSGGASLPVCYSPQALHDYTKHDNHQDQILPCICGDSLGNETTPFQIAARFNTWVGFENGRGLAEACATSFEMDKISPVPIFLTYCRLGWHWPNHKNKELNIPHDSHRIFGNHTDPYCDRFIEEVDLLVEDGKTINQTTCHMCTKSNTSAAIFQHQKGKQNLKGKVHHNQKSMWENCLNFLFVESISCAYGAGDFCCMPHSNDYHVKRLHKQFCHPECIGRAEPVVGA